MLKAKMELSGKLGRHSISVKAPMGYRVRC